MKEVKAVTREEWELGLDEFDYTSFSNPEWVESFSNNERKPIYLEFYRKEKVVGKLLGLIINPDAPVKKYLFFHSGILLKKSDSEVLRYCILNLKSYSKRNSYNRLIIRSYDYFNISWPKVIGFYQAKRSEYIVDIEADEHVINSRIKKTARQNYKRAIKRYGAQFHVCNSPQILDCLIELLQETRKIRISKGFSDYTSFYLPFLTKKEALLLLEKNIAELHYATTNTGDINCIQFFITYKQRAYVLLIGTNEQGYKQMLPVFLDYSMTFYFKRKGFKTINLGGIPDSNCKGLIYYKESIGGEKYNLTGGTTNYLTFPKNVLNPALILGRKLPSTNNFIKRLRECI